jgi:hypothetical protein
MKLEPMHVEFRNGTFWIEDKQIGSLMGVGKETTAYVSNRKRHEHYFRKFKGWGIAEAVLDWLIEHDVPLIIIRDTHSGEILTANVHLYKKHGIPYQKLPYEPQMVLPEKHFTKNGLQKVLFG